MAVLVLTQPQPSEPFLEAFARLAPHETVYADLETARRAADDIEAIVLWRLSPGVLGPFRSLRMLCASAAGVDKILACPDRAPDLPVTRTVDDAQNQQIAQYVVMMVLRHVRGLVGLEKQALARAWRRQPIPAPAAVRIGLLGLGQSGQAVARALLPLGFTVLGHSRRPRPVDGVQVYSGPDGLQQMLAQTQVLVCLLPLTSDTTGLIDARLLAQMPRGAYVINVARGDLLVEPDLIAAISSGQLAGAALDVQAREPLPADDPLWDDPRVLVTPHIASLPHPDTVVRQVIENLGRARAGAPLLRQVDPTQGY
jgi:D-3-phosphoglycerate dehydrogenase/glyoxylate/hydroxypyruvate reductase A